MVSGFEAVSLLLKVAETETGRKATSSKIGVDA